MKRLHQLITLSLLFLTCNSLLAQKKNFPGYYITLQGDTVKGVFPSYTQWSKSPSQATFLVENTTTPIQLTAQNTRKFVVVGYDEYLSYTGLRLTNPIDNGVLLSHRYSVSLADSSEQVTAFLRVVIKTQDVNLYVLNDVKRMNFYYQLSNGQITELRYKKSFDLNRISEVSEYRQQLNNLFGDAIRQKKLTARLEKLQYMEDDLSLFFRSLFSSAEVNRKKQSGGAEWFVSAGVALNMVSVHGENFYNAVPRKYKSSFSPLLSVGFILPIARNFGKYFLYPQVKLFRYKNTGEEIRGFYINSTTYQSNLSVVAEISGGVNVINRENLHFYFAVGVGMLTQMGAKEIKQSYRESDRTPYGGPTEVLLPRLTYSIDASTGVKLNKKLLLSATYVVPASIGNFFVYIPKLSGVQLRVGYRL